LRKINIGVGQQHWPWYEEATNAKMLTDDPTDPGDAADLSSVGYSNCRYNIGQMLPRSARSSFEKSGANTGKNQPIDRVNPELAGINLTYFG